jgi:hypothetical protein
LKNNILFSKNALKTVDKRTLRDYNIHCKMGKFTVPIFIFFLYGVGNSARQAAERTADGQNQPES